MHIAQRKIIIILSTAIPLLVLLIGLSLPSAAATVPSANLLLNGDFSDGSNNWFTFGGDHTTDTTTGAMCITINTDVTNPWEMQLGQNGFALIDGEEYTISFDAMATTSRNLSFKTGDAGPTFGDYTYQTVNVTTTMQPYEITYTQTGDDAGAQFAFHLGGQGVGELCIDNVMIEQVSAPPPNMLLNGDFSEGFNSWELSLNGDGAATADTSSGAACIDITNGSDAIWHVQLQQADLNLVKDVIYQIQFDVMTSVDRDVSYKTGDTGPAFANYTFQTYSATTVWETVTHTYTQSADDATAIFQFQLGNGGNNVVCVDNVSLTAVGMAPPPSGDNLIANGDFASGIDPWQLQLSGTGAATSDTSSGALCLNITDPSANQWEIVVNQGGINLRGGFDYTIMFDVMADAERELFYKTGSTSFANYTYQSAQATTDWTTIDFTYTQPEDDAASIFEFQLGARGAGEICLDNVKLVEQPAPLDRDIARNGSFDDGISGWQPFTIAPAQLEVDIIGGEMELTVVQTGTEVFNAMLWQLNLPVVQEYQYSLRFDARADIPNDSTRTIFAKVGMDPAPYTTYGGGDLELTNVMSPYQIDFTMNDATDGCAKIEFHLSQTTGTIFLDNVQLLTNAPDITDTGSVSYTTPSTNDGLSLRQLAENRDFYVGAASDTGTFNCNALHNEVMKTEFNSFTPANAMKMGPLQPLRGQFQWDDADKMVDFAEENGIEFHGHALVWHAQMSAFADRYDISRTEMISIMYEHIDAVAGRYAGRIQVWDVVNEAIDDNRGDDGEIGSGEGDHELRVTPWQANIGDDYIALAFERAHQTDPNAILIYNDYVISEKGRSKADAAFSMIRQLQADGVPIDGVGFQMHWDLTQPPDVQGVIDNMARYDVLDLEVYITEIDVRIPNTLTLRTNEPLLLDALEEAAQVYGDMLQACVDAPNCKHFTTWGISDVDSWIPGFFPGFGRAHIFDENFEAKPAYFVLSNILAANPSVVGLVSAETQPASSTTLIIITLTILLTTTLWLKAKKQPD